jgi:hypothetical protein
MMGRGPCGVPKANDLSKDLGLHRINHTRAIESAVWLGARQVPPCICLSNGFNGYHIRWATEVKASCRRHLPPLLDAYNSEDRLHSFPRWQHPKCHIDPFLWGVCC